MVCVALLSLGLGALGVDGMDRDVVEAVGRVMGSALLFGNGIGGTVLVGREVSRLVGCLLRRVVDRLLGRLVDRDVSRDVGALVIAELMEKLLETCVRLVLGRIGMEINGPL